MASQRVCSHSAGNMRPFVRRFLNSTPELSNFLQALRRKRHKYRLNGSCHLLSRIHFPPRLHLHRCHHLQICSHRRFCLHRHLYHLQWPPFLHLSLRSLQSLPWILRWPFRLSNHSLSIQRCPHLPILGLRFRCRLSPAPPG